MFTSKLIKKAWKIRKDAAKKFECKVSEISWKECLVMANEKTRESMRLDLVLEKDKVRLILHGKGTYEQREQIKSIGYVFGYDVVNENGKSKEKFWNQLLDHKAVAPIVRKSNELLNITHVNKFGKMIKIRG